MDDQQLKFLGRYRKFWRFFHPGKPEPENLLTTILDYYEYSEKMHIPFEIFDEACTTLERDIHRFAFDGFNIMAYTLDFMHSEQERRRQEEANYRIELPKEGRPIDHDLENRIKSVLDKLKFKNRSLYGILERINALRPWVTQSTVKCAACNDTGWVGNPAKKCVCPTGQRLQDGIPATNEDCRLAALEREA